MIADLRDKVLQAAEEIDPEKALLAIPRRLNRAVELNEATLK